MLDLTKPMVYLKDGKEHPLLLEAGRIGKGNKAIYFGLYAETSSPFPTQIWFNKSGYLIAGGKRKHHQQVFNLPSLAEHRRIVEKLGDMVVELTARDYDAQRARLHLDEAATNLYFERSRILIHEKVCRDHPWETLWACLTKKFLVRQYKQRGSFPITEDNNE